MSRKTSKTAIRKKNKGSKKAPPTVAEYNNAAGSKLSRICTIFGLALCLAALWTAFANLHAEPVLLKTPESATQRVTALMDSLCSGDHEGVEAVLYGNPDLGLDQPPQSEAGKRIYPLYRDSLSYEIAHAPSVTDTGLALCVAVTGLDAFELAETLAEQVAQLPAEEAGSSQSWDIALAQISEDSYPQASHTITLNLVYAQDQWWVLPEEPLLKVISGTME